jgi:hypothetical protein
MLFLSNNEEWIVTNGDCFILYHPRSNHCARALPQGVKYPDTSTIRSVVNWVRILNVPSAGLSPT